MPDIKFDHIVSCSSEDLHHPASNLLKPETYRKWRCEKGGEPHAAVIIQLEKESLIHTIDIGNNGSATVEVLVGKSSTPDAKYEVLLPASSLMNPNESKNMEQMNRVRMFGFDKLCPDIAKKKWDRIQIYCTQPWGHHAYGLSFISLHSPPDVREETSSTTLGRFVLRDEPKDDIRPGSIFAKWKVTKDDTPQAPKTGTAAAAIAEASSPSSLVAMEAKKTKAAKIVPKKRQHSNGTSPEAKKSNGFQSPKKAEGKPHKDNRKALERDTPSPEPPSSPEATSPTKKATPSPQKAIPLPKKATPPPKKATTTTTKTTVEQKTSRKTTKQEIRPFNQLMSNVTFVLSGFQNPLRANLREMALNMGARYQQDWNSTCTHLICAFANTPKARQVRGHGKIVKKEWIEHCHRERKRFPWRRYALNSAEGEEEESEEEIWAEADEPEASTSGSHDQGTSSGMSPDRYDADTDDEEVEEVPVPPKPEPQVVDLDEYNADTDVESEDTMMSKLPPLPDLFIGKCFAIHEDLSQEDKAQLRRYVVALGGKIKDDLDNDVNYLVTETSEGLDALEQCYPDVTAVLPTWVWKCNDSGKLLPESEFKLEPVYH